MKRNVFLYDVLEIQNGFAFDSALFNKSEDGMPIIRIRDLARGFSETYYSGDYDKRFVVKRNDLLIGMDGEFRCYLWQGEDALLNQRVCRLQNFSDELNSKYIYYLINKYLIEIENSTAFVTVKHISSKQISAIQIPLPSLPEQEGIVRLLDEAESLRATRERANARMEQFVPALFQEMFGDVVKNEKNWNIKKFSELGQLDRGKSKHRPRDAAFLYGGKYPFVQTGDIANSNGQIISYSQTYSEEGLAQSKLWSVGTLCITIAANIGKTAILTFPACFPDSIVGFTPDNSLVDIEFIRQWLVTIESDLDAIAPQSAQKNINLGILRELPVPLPPLALQREFAARVEEARGVQSAQGKSAGKVEALYQSMLSKAFAGEL